MTSYELVAAFDSKDLKEINTLKSYELLMTSYELEGNFDSKDLQDIKTSKSYVLLMTSYELGLSCPDISRHIG